MGEQTRTWPRSSRLAAELPMVLVVDDEETTARTLQRQLAGDYRVLTAPDGPEALRVMAEEGPIAVVVSDLWMPGMDGVSLLSQVRQGFPDTSRVLHTGHADLRTAVSAINDGHVFRFLIKPCSVAELRQTVRDAVERYRVVLAERQVLDGTLRASLQALFDCLELASPLAFARAARIRNLVSALCHAMGLTGAWEIEVAAMASQLGAVTLPPGVLTKLDQGRTLSSDERQMVDALPEIAERLLGGIPRLDPVIDIIRGLGPARGARDRPPPQSTVVARGIEVIDAAMAFEALHTRGVSAQGTVAALESSQDWGEEVLAAFRQLYGSTSTREEVRELSVRELEVGMRVMEDLRTEQGLVLIGRGTAVTEVMLDRLDNFARTTALTGPVVAALPVDERLRIRERFAELIDEDSPEDVDFVRNLVGSFLQGSRELLDSLRTAVESSDGRLAARHAHTLKGAAANVGAARVSDICAVIEQLLEEEELTRASREVTRLEAALAQAPVEFSAAFESFSVPSPS